MLTYSRAPFVSLSDVEESNRIDVVCKTLQTLPEENYQVLCLLMAFLAEVSCSIWLRGEALLFSAHCIWPQLCYCPGPPSSTHMLPS